jgi:SanA protein
MTVRDVARVACAAALLVALGANAVVGESSRRSIFDERNVPPMQTALVFGAGVEPDGSPSAMLGDRLDLAVQLFRDRKVERILLSADDRAGDREIPAMLARTLAREYRATACSSTIADSRHATAASGRARCSGCARRRS